MLAPLIILVSALPAAGFADMLVMVVGHRIAARVEDRRVARLLAEIDAIVGLGQPNQASIDAWVLETCGPRGLEVYMDHEVGGRVLKVTPAQKRLLIEALMEDGDNRRLRPLLTRIVVQTASAAA